MGTKKKKLETYSPSVRQKNKRIEEPEDERCCGNCCVFTDEDADGNGWCGHYDIETTCTTVFCKDFVWLNEDD